jgi:hypothetical protein
MPDIDRKAGFAWNDVARAGRDFDHPDRGQQPGGLPRQVLRGQDDLGCRREWIAAEMHRHGARVPRFTGKRGQNPALTGDRRHHPNGRVN